MKCAFAVFALCSAVGFGQTAPRLTTLYSFQGGSDGKFPFGLAIASGVLYGATGSGGTGSCHRGCGTVFSLAPPSSTAGAWVKTELYSFTGGADGSGPSSAIFIGQQSAGHLVLYGMTAAGGANNAGTVYSLQPPAISGGAWTETVLYSFTGGSDGGDPGSIAMATSGVLYGTARSGGTGLACAGGCGTVFSLTPPASPSTNWNEKVLYDFIGGADGWAPLNIVIGEAGVLFGITIYGGTYNNGTVFSLTPPSSSVASAWSQTVLASFNGVYGLVIGSGGILYGTTINGGTYNGGTAFSLTPPASPGGAWTQTILHSFQTCPFSASCVEPTGIYHENFTGRLYGLTIFGGANRVGSVYSLTPPASAGQPWIYKVLHSFNQTDGADPSSLVLTNGVLYGTTGYKGGADAGTVFSFAP